MDSKVSIKKILVEQVQKYNNGELNPLEVKMMKLLEMQDFPRDVNPMVTFFRDKVGLSGYEAYRLTLLYIYNKNKATDGWDNVKNPTRVDPETKVMKTANNRAREQVVNKIPFKGSNTSGNYVTNGNFVVWSYDWYPLFVFDGSKWYENEQRYSVSTSKQTSQLRPYNDKFPIEVISYDAIKKLTH
jgi:hypothetical protein